MDGYVDSACRTKKDQHALEKGKVYSDLRASYIIFVCPFDPFKPAGLRRYTFRNRCDERHELVLQDKATKIFLNAKGRLGNESPDVLAFLDYVNTNTVTDGFAAQISAEVDKVKANGKERNLYMTLAMDLLEHIEQNKGTWFDEGKAEGRLKGRVEGEAKGKADVACKMVQLGMPFDQISEITVLSIEQIRALPKVQ